MFFDWFAARIRDSFLSGVNQALARLDTAAEEQPATAPIVLRLTVAMPEPAAEESNGKRKRTASA